MRGNDDGPGEAMRSLLREADVPVRLPAWFEGRVLHEARRRERVASGAERVASGGWGWILSGFLSWRGVVPLFGAALLWGGWMGYRGGEQQALHLAEVRYMDEVDPVHRHP